MARTLPFLYASFLLGSFGSSEPEKRSSDWDLRWALLRSPAFLTFHRGWNAVWGALSSAGERKGGGGGSDQRGWGPLLLAITWGLKVLFSTGEIALFNACVGVHSQPCPGFVCFIFSTHSFKFLRFTNWLVFVTLFADWHLSVGLLTSEKSFSWDPYSSPETAHCITWSGIALGPEWLTWHLCLFQVVTNRDTQETLLCMACVFEVSNSEHGAQHHIYRLVKEWDSWTPWILPLHRLKNLKTKWQCL